MAHEIHSGAPSSSRGVTDFGTVHDHKPTKAMIGVALMIVLGFVFYELGGKSPAMHSSSRPAAHQTVASSSH
ncbi:MAG TPA: hypothetical protein VIQ05_13040 [Tardiphaga sp.]